MVDAIVHRNLGNLERVHAFQATDVEAVLFGIRSPLMMSVDPAGRTEVVFGSLRIELVDLDTIATFRDS